MLYDCKAGEVRLEKELEVMKNYVNLEKERYGNTIEVSWSVEGNTKDKFISPLLILPFLEILCSFFRFWKMHLTMAYPKK